jgi:hypothetical protein
MAEQSMDRKVQLGCGTLIIIAIIVMVFSGGSGSRRVRAQLDDVERKIDGLERKIDELSRKLDRLPSSVPATPRVR